MATNKPESPCLKCTRVQSPSSCENKCCDDWKKWWLAEWEAARTNPLIQQVARGAAAAPDPEPESMDASEWLAKILEGTVDDE